MKPFIGKSGEAQQNARLFPCKQEYSPSSENPEENSLVEKPYTQREVQLIPNKLAYNCNSINNTVIRQSSNSFSKNSDFQKSGSNLEYNDKTSSFQKVVKGNGTISKAKG